MIEPCRLCDHKAAEIYTNANKRTYLRCPNCDLIFVAKADLPSRDEEYAEYLHHNNDRGDPRYRAHLSKLTIPLTNGLPSDAQGLDFGAGPGPTISVMLGEKGYDVSNYDPMFAPDAKMLAMQYDFIASTEVVEHFHNPKVELALLARLLKPGGRLGVMTQLYDDSIEFKSWYYPREVSHVAFYTRKTMSHIARKFGWSCEIIANDVILFQS